MSASEKLTIRLCARCFRSSVRDQIERHHFFGGRKGPTIYLCDTCHDELNKTLFNGIDQSNPAYSILVARTTLSFIEAPDAKKKIEEAIAAAPLKRQNDWAARESIRVWREHQEAVSLSSIGEKEVGVSGLINKPASLVGIDFGFSEDLNWDSNSTPPTKPSRSTSERGIIGRAVAAVLKKILPTRISEWVSTARTILEEEKNPLASTPKTVMLSVTDAIASGRKKIERSTKRSKSPSSGKKDSNGSSSDLISL
jgi:hypothetical protein